MNIPAVLKLTTSWSPCEAPRASARDQRARDQRDIISHGSQSQAGASSLQSIKGSSLSSSFDWRYVQKPEQQITKAHIWSKQWSICHGCFLRPHFLPLVKRKRSGSETEIEARPQTDLSSENKSTDGGRSRIPTTWARVSIEPLLLLFVTMWAWWWWSGISSLLTGGHKPPSWVRIWERVGLERSLYGGATLVGFKSVRMACELVQDHKIWKTSVWFSRIRVTCCQIGRLGVLVHYSSHDDKNKEIRVIRKHCQILNVSSNTKKAVKHQWELSLSKEVLCKSIFPLFAVARTLSCGKLPTFWKKMPIFPAKPSS